MARRRPSLADAVHGAATGSRRGGAGPGGDTAGATKGLLLRLPSDLHRQLRQLALDRDTSMQALGVEALERTLREHHEQQR